MRRAVLAGGPVPGRHPYVDACRRRGGLDFTLLLLAVVGRISRLFFLPFSSGFCFLFFSEPCIDASCSLPRFTTFF